MGPGLSRQGAVSEERKQGWARQRGHERGQVRQEQQKREEKVKGVGEGRAWLPGLTVDFFPEAVVYS